PDQRSRVFQSFVRLYNEDKSQTSGFGLGLAIVQRIMKWHGGEAIFVDSHHGGARIVGNWPLVCPVTPLRAASARSLLKRLPYNKRIFWGPIFHLNLHNILVQPPLRGWLWRVL